MDTVKGIWAASPSGLELESDSANSRDIIYSETTVAFAWVGSATSCALPSLVDYFCKRAEQD